MEQPWSGCSILPAPPSLCSCWRGAAGASSRAAGSHKCIYLRGWACCFWGGKSGHRGTILFCRSFAAHPSATLLWRRLPCHLTHQWHHPLLHPAHACRPLPLPKRHFCAAACASTGSCSSIAVRFVGTRVGSEQPSRSHGMGTAFVPSLWRRCARHWHPVPRLPRCCGLCLRPSRNCATTPPRHGWCIFYCA